MNRWFLLKLLILTIICVEFFVSFRILVICPKDSTKQFEKKELKSDKFDSPNVQLRSVDELNRLNVKTLKALAKKYLGHESGKRFFEKTDLVQYVYELQLDAHSPLHEFLGDFEDGWRFAKFLDDSKRPLLIWYTNFRNNYAGNYFYSTKLRRHLAAKYWGVFDFVLVNCDKENAALKEICRAVGLTRLNGCAMVLPNNAECICHVTSFKSESSVDDWLQKFFDQKSGQVAECGIKIRTNSKKLDEFRLQSLSCNGNKRTKNYEDIFNGQKEANSLLKNIVCPTYLKLEAITETLMILFGILSLSYNSGFMTMTIYGQLKNAFFALFVQVIVCTPVSFVFTLIPVQRLILTTLCKSDIWIWLCKFFIHVSGRQNVSRVLDSDSSRYFFGVFFTLLIVLQNKIICKLFKLNTDYDNRIRWKSLILYLPIFVSKKIMEFFHFSSGGRMVHHTSERPTRSHGNEFVSNNGPGSTSDMNNLPQSTWGRQTGERYLPLQPLRPYRSVEEDHSQGPDMDDFTMLIRQYLIQSMMQQTVDNEALKLAKNVLNKDARCKILTAETCSICQNEMAKGQWVYDIQCGHVFHVKCLRAWVYGHNQHTCPNCRQNIT